MTDACSSKQGKVSMFSEKGANLDLLNINIFLGLLQISLK